MHPDDHTTYGGGLAGWAKRGERVERSVGGRAGRVVGSGAQAREPFGGAGWRRVRRGYRQAEVGEDRGDHRGRRDRGEQTQAAAAVRAGEHVDREGAAQQVRPRDMPVLAECDDPAAELARGLADLQRFYARALEQRMGVLAYTG